MPNLFQSLTQKLGLSKETVTDQADNLLEQNRDKIPDAIEDKIEEAIHGDMVGGLLDKIGLGGADETPVEEPVVEEEPTEEEATDEEETPEEETEEESQ